MMEGVCVFDEDCYVEVVKMKIADKITNSHICCLGLVHRVPGRYSIKDASEEVPRYSLQKIPG